MAEGSAGPVASAGPPEACSIVFHTLPVDHKSIPIVEVKATPGKVGKEERRAAGQDKKQQGAKDKEDKKGAKLPGREASPGLGPGRAPREGWRTPWTCTGSSEAVPVSVFPAGPCQQQEAQGEG